MAPFARLNQDEVDVERARALLSLTSRAKKLSQYVSNAPGWKYPIFHIWFPEPRTTLIELRQGNPPSDSARPPWLKGVHLELDLNVGVPRTMRAMFARSKAAQERLQKQTGITTDEATNEEAEVTGLSAGLVSVVKRLAEQRAERDAATVARSNAAIAEKRRLKNRVRRRRLAAHH